MLYYWLFNGVFYSAYKDFVYACMLMMVVYACVER